MLALWDHWKKISSGGSTQIPKCYYEHRLNDFSFRLFQIVMKLSFETSKLVYIVIPDLIRNPETTFH